MVKLFAFCCRRIGPVVAVILLSTVTAKAGQDCAAVPLPIPACQAGTHSVCTKFFNCKPGGALGIVKICTQNKCVSNHGRAFETPNAALAKKGVKLNPQPEPPGRIKN